jgi:addiction module RelE/StbE family toxin
MNVLTHRTFDKVFEKLHPKVQNKCYEVLETYARNKHDTLLHNHALVGRFLGYGSINVSGDYRIIFEAVDDETIHLVNIGTHSQLYG